MATRYPVLEVTLNVTVEIEYDAEGKDEGIGRTEAEAMAKAQHELGALGFTPRYYKGPIVEVAVVEYDAPVVDRGVEIDD